MAVIFTPEAYDEESYRNIKDTPTPDTARWEKSRIV